MDEENCGSTGAEDARVVDAMDRAITDLTGQPQLGSAYAKAFVKRLAEYGVVVVPAAAPADLSEAPHHAAP